MWYLPCQKCLKFFKECTRQCTVSKGRQELPLSL